MDIIVEQVKSYIEVNRLIDFDKPVIVGFSGGPDSVALLSILSSIGIKCIAAHCNFHLRGEESDRDMRFVEQFAKSKGIELHIIHFDTEEYAKKHHLSIEMAARELRYRWFEDLKKSVNADLIAIAHHSDDVIETFFINLLRGSGIHGLTGIRPKNGSIVRPLLCISRQDILDYIERNGLKYVVDSTNNSNDYLRNKIRNIIIPNLTDAASSAKKSILKSIFYLGEYESVINSVSEDWKRKFTSYSNGFTTVNLLELQFIENKKIILYELLKPYGITDSLLKEILRCGINDSGIVFLTAHYKILKNRDKLEIVEKEYSSMSNYEISITDEFTVIDNPLNMQFHVLNVKDYTLNKDKSNCYLDYDKLKFPLYLRSWKEGDYFIPFGKNQKKKLSDFFINEKMSVLEKQRCFLLTNADDEVLWVVGRRPDNRFRITEKTNKILHISI